MVSHSKYMHLICHVLYYNGISHTFRLGFLSLRGEEYSNSTQLFQSGIGTNATLAVSVSA